MKKIGLLLLVLFCFFEFGFAQQENFEKIASKHFKNMYKINDVLYRSEQPSKKGFKEVEGLGIGTVLNLRRLKDNSKKAKGINLEQKHIPIKTKELNYQEIIDALKIIKKAKEPVLVHCWHGSDRTGTVVAAYRIIIENWTKEKAITEFTNATFGYHKKMYPNLLELLKNMDVDFIRKALNEN